MRIPTVGSHVEYFRNEPSRLDGGGVPLGNAIVRIKHAAIVTGYERPADHDPETDGLPTINLAYVEPSDVAAFQGVNWTDGFERAFSVPHEGVDKTGHHFYRMPAIATDADKKLQVFLLANFKSETGDETPVDCAIRLLSKSKKK